MAVNSALTPNSTFTQSTLNLLYQCAFLAYMYIYGNTYYNLVFDSATAAYIYFYGYTSCNGSLIANNAPAYSLNQFSIFVYDSASTVHMYIDGNTSCNDTLTANNALTPNSTFT